MAQKRNEWLEADLGEEEADYHSDDADESRSRSLAKRSAKRRRLDSDQESDPESANDEPEEQKSDGTEIQNISRSSNTASVPKKSNIDKKLSKVRDATSRSGVIYISRVPPFMKPHTLKNLLLPYASKGIGRIFLTPESHDQRQSRIRGGGNKKKSFTDGWVEFTSKKQAKSAVEMLNARNIGGKKGGYYVDDVWNLKYLKGFKWRHLTEQITNENAERSARMRAEGSSSRREMNEFLRNVDRSKIEATRQRKRTKANASDGKLQSDNSAEAHDRFRQNHPVASRDMATDLAPSDDVQRVLSKIF